MVKKLNIFNRIIVILILFFLIIFSIVIMVNIFTDLFQWSDIFNRILAFMGTINIYIAALIFFLIIIISIALLFLEFYRRKVKITNIASVKDGKASITLKSVSQQIVENLSDIENISNLKVKSFPKSDGTIINVYARLEKGISVSEKMQEVINKVNQFATENLGLKVIRTNFTVTDFMPGPKRAAVDKIDDEYQASAPAEPKELKTTDEDYD